MNIRVYRYIYMALKKNYTLYLAQKQFLMIKYIKLLWRRLLNPRINVHFKFYFVRKIQRTEL